MPADSSALRSRWISEVRAWTVFIRYRARSRTSFSSGARDVGAGQQPALVQIQQPGASLASVLWPFSALACAGLITAPR